MSEKMRAMIGPYSSTVGQSVMLIAHDGRVYAQLAVLAPVGPPPGEDHKTFSSRIANLVADKINQ